MKDLAKQYALLTADERFRLFVEALGRQDVQELDRLENTCPRHQYRAQEAQYTWKKAHFTILSLATALHKLRVELLATTALVIVLISDDTGKQAAEEQALGALVRLMLLRRGIRDGWERFCEHIGADPNAVAAPFVEDTELAMRSTEAAFATLAADYPDEINNVAGIAEREFEALTDAWRRRTE